MALQRRTRRSRAGADTGQLQALVNALIKENRTLKRSLERLTSRTLESKSLPTRQVVALTRKVERALAPDRFKRTPTRKTPKSQRPPASPETRQRRLEALAKARAVRAANRQGSLTTDT